MPKSVLIVDDEPRITAALMIRLESAGFTVYHAINGIAGIEASRMHKPDAIVLDIRMPDIEGYDVCRQIRQDSELADTPVVFLSANVQETAQRKAIDAGGNAFIAKPYEASDIINTLNRLLDDAVIAS